MSEYEARMMSSTLSKLNPAFFSGTVVEIYRIIEVEEQYLNKYIQIKHGLMKKLLTPPADAEIIED